MRRKLVAGNWKMNGDRAAARALCADIAAGVGAESEPVEIAVCPPNLLIPTAREALAGALAGGAIALGAQDVDANDNGARTGQTSARMLADSGCRYVIVGHSERRQWHSESDELAAQKAAAALAFGVRPIVCVGETQTQREAGDTEAILARQVDALLAAMESTPTPAPTGGATWADAVIAYEPVWAIGTGLTAAPEQAQQAHQFIRGRLAAHAAGAQIAAACRILYGGSMKPDNAAQLIAQPDIDGGLIGGAALDAGDFLAVIAAAGAA